MTLSDKLSVLCDTELHLYKEGVFWVAYEQDAFRLLASTPMDCIRFVEELQ